MAKNTIDAIREAELASQEKEKDARAEAVRLVEEAHRAAKSVVGDKLAGLKSEDEKMVEAAGREGAQLLEAAEKEAETEIAALRNDAEKNEKAAIKAVLDRLTA